MMVVCISIYHLIFSFLLNGFQFVIASVSSTTKSLTQPMKFHGGITGVGIAGAAAAFDFANRGRKLMLVE